MGCDDRRVEKPRIDRPRYGPRYFFFFAFRAAAFAARPSPSSAPPADAASAGLFSFGNIAASSFVVRSYSGFAARFVHSSLCWPAERHRLRGCALAALPNSPFVLPPLELEQVKRRVGSARMPKRKIAAAGEPVIPDRIG